MPAHAPTPDLPEQPAPPDPADVPGPPGEPGPLDAERAHLAASRTALRAMRADAEALDIGDVTANWVNAAVLQSEIDLRVKSLADLAHAPLFFGRLDFDGFPDPYGAPVPAADTAPDDTGERHTFYIGRRHVHDHDGDPMVIDWRAPVSQPFYRASGKDPQGVALRRRFGYTAGELTAYEDERLSGPGADAASGPAASTLLQREIERPRVGPMRDIVATIQPEQDTLVRASVDGTVCVQGAPAPARPPSACTASRTSSTPTANGSPAPAPWSSGRTARSCTTSSRCCPPWASWTSSRRRWTTWCGTRRSPCGPATPPRRRASRATPGWRAYCAARCAPA